MTLEELLNEIEFLFKLIENLELEITSIQITNFNGVNILIE